MMRSSWESAVMVGLALVAMVACADVPTESAVRLTPQTRAARSAGAVVEVYSGTESTDDHVSACGQSIDLTGTVDYTFRIVTDGHGGWHRVVDIEESLSGIAQPSGAVYTGSISIHETSELPGGDSDDSWPFAHTFQRQVRLSSPTGPDITVRRLYHATGTPDARIVVETSTRVERCGQ
jgi:hypothetical protein